MEGEKEWDDYIRKCLKDLTEEAPPEGFTAQVMKAVGAEKKYVQKSGYAPVFSRTSWVLVAIAAFTLLVLGFTAKGDQALFGLFTPDLDLIPGSMRFWEGIEPVAGTRILVYASLSLCSFFCLQIFLLKKSWEHKKVYF
ncbi:hypothetical protein SAMN06265375_1011353 [Muriicola jejuensis]|uniref:Uncharacterized protein n=1 Tax=Muriicola jejuensis TaxID=504488 RepID=A0A6P0U9B1_9FLAO|nr:hypothetical protein [Muriicola jejuensis]NER09162.1 hypothetical protein [Muriicola jejuensis]SMP10708.1 hypothetical protein SAMN06265375_1011353 [Muriicola jejuensis]